MSKEIRIKKGLDITLKGEAIRSVGQTPILSEIALRPDDFYGLTPKLLVQEGQEVNPGTPIFCHKAHPAMVFVSPVQGQVKAIVRGDKRKLLHVLITPVTESGGSSPKAEVPELQGMTPEVLISALLSLGMWPLFRERPFGLLANPNQLPKAIHVSAFDSAPLGADLEYMVSDELPALHKGFEVLKALGVPVHLGVRSTTALGHLTGIQQTVFKGPHPAGNVGVQINRLNPINKGETVWTITLPHVLVLGRLFLNRSYNFTQKVAICGSEVFAPGYFKMIPGAKLDFLKVKLVDKENVRVISGHVLSGRQVSVDADYLGFYDYQISAIPEGRRAEFLGWGMPRLDKFSASRTYFSWLFPGKKYKLDTNTNGGERAFVVTNQYEQVFPMDIYPVHLLKAILAKDIDKMEQLGIYEVMPEDMALCEYVCTSKIEVQQIVREGIAMMVSEMN